jgi:cyclopropane-fatty-acyl-phospholipid synthase
MEIDYSSGRETATPTFIQRKAETYLKALFDQAGIRVDGTRPWDLQVHDRRFFPRTMFGGSLAFGESYMDGWWDCNGLDQFFHKALSNDLDRSWCKRVPRALKTMQSIIFNRQTSARAFQVGEHHYDAGNDLFELMLDPSMTYSCGYWREAKTLDEAQQAKLDLICRKLGLQPGMRMLDIGCGWGGLAIHAARHYGAEVVGLTVSKEQANLARQRCRGLPVEIRVQDYREVSGTFDAIASVGMFEHVGYKNYRIFMDVASRCLHRDGLFLLHTIGANNSVYCCDPWFDRYIFPNGMLPSIKQIGEAVEPYFVMEDWHNLGTDYDKTLLSWCQNFEGNWHKIRAKYTQRFYRMWRYYLLAMAGGFRARQVQVWQIVLSMKKSPGGYRSIHCRNC